jgi:hypothetical protein
VVLLLTATVAYRLRTLGTIAAAPSLYVLYYLYYLARSASLVLLVLGKDHPRRRK